MTGPETDHADRAAALLAAHPASRALGVTLVEAGPGRAMLRMVVQPHMVNAHEICHGGLLFGLADLACTVAASGTTARAVARGASIELLSPAPLGAVLEAAATVTSRRGRSGICDAVVTTPDGTVVALLRSRMGGLEVTAPAPFPDRG